MVKTQTLLGNKSSGWGKRCKENKVNQQVQPETCHVRPQIRGQAPSPLSLLSHTLCLSERTQWLSAPEHSAIIKGEGWEKGTAGEATSTPSLVGPARCSSKGATSVRADDTRLHEGRLHDLEPPEELRHEHQVVALHGRGRERGS